MSTHEEQVHYFDDVVEVVSDELRFKLKLGIGADAFTSLKYGKKVQELWDVSGFAATGAGLASSATVASTFFAKTGVLAAVGLGGAAATPLGWIVAAGAVSGAAYYGVTRILRGYSSNRVAEVPQFINTPIDILGANLVDLIAPLAVRIAKIDGDFDSREATVIQQYFVREWGINADYVDAALKVIDENTDDGTVKAIAKQVSAFVKANPDCNYSHITTDLLNFLNEIAQADHVLDEREELAIERVAAIFSKEGAFSLSAWLPKFRRSQQ